MDATYANMLVWRSLGNVVGYGYSNAVCNYIKIYIVVSLIILALICYIICEWVAAGEKTYAVEKDSNETDGVGWDNNGEVSITNYAESEKFQGSTYNNDNKMSGTDIGFCFKYLIMKSLL